MDSAAVEINIGNGKSYAQEDHYIESGVLYYAQYLPYHTSVGFLHMYASIENNVSYILAKVIELYTHISHILDDSSEVHTEALPFYSHNNIPNRTHISSSLEVPSSSITVS